MRRAGQLQRAQADIPADAVIDVHDQIARRQRRGVGDEARRLALATRRRKAVAQHILRTLPQARLATDSPGRETDIAIDHSEFTHLSADDIAQVVALMRAGGLNATVSSIHINGWIGSHDKLEGARWIVREHLGRSLDDELDHWVYVGDSTNDARMFGHFPHSVGVANVARFVPQLSHLPRYLAAGERGAGFAEVVDALLAAQPTA